MSDALFAVRERLLDVARLLAEGGGKADPAWVEDARRYVWGQIAALAHITLSPLPPLPRPRRGKRCVVCASSTPPRSGVALLAWIHR